MTVLKLKENNSTQRNAIMPLHEKFIEEAVKRAFEEDLGLIGDITAQYFVDEEAQAEAYLTPRQEGVLCGLDIARFAFHYLDADLEFESFAKDGDCLRVGEPFAKISGSARAILTAERTALNFLGHLSGIATKANSWSKMLSPYKTKLLDSRKTIPCLRALQKYAVRAGGALNHRMGLYDGVMVKDNHLAFQQDTRSLKQRVDYLRAHVGPLVTVEMEVDRLDQIEEALDAGVDVIMLDNMDAETLKKAVQMIKGRALTEASGNIRQERLVEVAETGVDYISSGALTHSVVNLDIGLDDFK